MGPDCRFLGIGGDCATGDIWVTFLRDENNRTVPVGVLLSERGWNTGARRTRLAFSEALHGKIAEADLFTYAEGVITEVISRAKR